MTKGDSRIISICVHRTVHRHPVVSTSNAESVEVSEDASELSRLRGVNRVASEIVLQALHPGAGNLLHD